MFITLQCTHLEYIKLMSISNIVQFKYSICEKKVNTLCSLYARFGTIFLSAGSYHIQNTSFLFFSSLRVLLHTINGKLLNRLKFYVIKKICTFFLFSMYFSSSDGLKLNLILMAIRTRLFEIMVFAWIYSLYWQFLLCISIQVHIMCVYIYLFIFLKCVCIYLCDFRRIQL